MIAEVYDALKSAGADDAKARAAAIAVADQAGIENLEQRLAATVGAFEQRLEARIDGVEQRLDARIDAVERRLGRVEERLTGVEDRLTKVERDVFLLKWMVGFVLALQLGTFFMLWQLMLQFPS
jgi:uncharacterized protein YPO0396